MKYVVALLALLQLLACPKADALPLTQPHKEAREKIERMSEELDIRIKEGNVPAQIDLLQRMIPVLNTAYSPGDNEIINAQRELIRLLVNTKRFAEADALSDAIIKLHDQPATMSENSYILALSYIAGANQNAGRYHKAESLCQRGLDVCRGEHGYDRMTRSELLEMLAGCYRSEGRHDLEEPVLLDDIYLLQSASQPNEQRLADDYQYLGYCQLEQKRIEDAIVSFRSGARHAKKLPSSSSSYGNLLLSLASAYTCGHRTREALPIYEELLKLKTADHSLRMAILENAGNAFSVMDNMIRCRTLYDQAMELARKDNNKVQMATVDYLRGAAELHSGNVKVAEQYLRRCLPIARQQTDMARQLTWCLEQLSKALVAQGKFKEAFETSTECIALQRKIKVPAHELAHAICSQAQCYANEKKYDQALAGALESMRLRTESRTKDVASVPPSVMFENSRILADIYQRTGKQAQAKYWRAQADKFKAMPK